MENKRTEIEALAQHNFAFVQGVVAAPDWEAWVKDDTLADEYRKEADGILTFLRERGWGLTSPVDDWDSEKRKNLEEAIEYWKRIDQGGDPTYLDMMCSMTLQQARTELDLLSYSSAGTAGWYIVRMASYIVAEYVSRREEGLL